MKLKQNRIIFLDIIRAIAVLMMVQGHTVHTLLDTSLRSFDSPFYSVWHYLRGFTAPIFMFTSGVVFTYLLHLNGKGFFENPRVKKGIKRFILLLSLGYLLRYPTWRIIDFSNVTEKQWLTFFTVDALHLIGFGLLFIILIYFLSDTLKLNFSLVAFVFTISIIFISPWSNSYNWNEILPLWIANYFTHAYGSFFPLLPWLAYLSAGSLLGNFLANNPGVQRGVKFPIRLAAISLFLLAIHYLTNHFGLLSFNGNSIVANTEIFLRLSVVVFLNALIAFLVLELESIPKVILSIGRNTLPIYVIHLVILYGSAWSYGLSYIIGATLSIKQTVFSVVIMLIFVILLVAILENANKLKKKLYSLVEA